MAKRARKPQVLGVPLPDGVPKLNMKNFDMKGLKNFDMKGLKNFDRKGLAKQIGNVAGRLEQASDDIRMVSAQAKRLSDKLS